MDGGATATGRLGAAAAVVARGTGSGLRGTCVSIVAALPFIYRWILSEFY